MLLQAMHCQREVGNLVNFLKISWCERSAERRGQCLHQLTQMYKNIFKSEYILMKFCTHENFLLCCSQRAQVSCIQNTATLQYWSDQTEYWDRNGFTNALEWMCLVWMGLSVECKLSWNTTACGGAGMEVCSDLECDWARMELERNGIEPEGVPCQNGLSWNAVPWHQPRPPLGSQSWGRRTWPPAPRCSTPRGSGSYARTPFLLSWPMLGEQCFVPECVCPCCVYVYVCECVCIHVCVWVCGCGCGNWGTYEIDYYWRLLD